MSKTKPWHLSRRHLLRGAGVTMALPFLEAMMPTHRAAAALGSGRQPIRFAAFFMPNGVNHARWDIGGKGSGLGDLSPSLQPLADLKDEIIVVQGLSGTGAHNLGTSGFLTGRAPKKTPKANEVNVGNASLDQIIGATARESAVLPTLELGMSAPRRGVGVNGASHVYTSFVSGKNATTPVPPELNPKRAFDRLFKGARVNSASGRPGSGSQPTVPDASVLDLVLEDAKSLQKQLGSADQQKLDEYLTAVREVEERITNQQQAAKGRTITPAVMEDIKAVSSRLRKSDLDSRDRKGISAVPQIPYRAYGRLMMDVQALALWSNSTRATTLMFGDGLHSRNMSFLEGVDGNHHSISHHGNRGASLAMYSKINTFFVEQYAYFLDRLKGMSEAGGSVLDNSVVLLGSNMGDGQAHNSKNLPLLIAGQGGNRLRTGRKLLANGAHISQVHNALLDRMNIEREIGNSKSKLKGL